jgi:hypothetical protein
VTPSIIILLLHQARHAARRFFVLAARARHVRPRSVTFCVGISTGI